MKKRLACRRRLRGAAGIRLSLAALLAGALAAGTLDAGGSDPSAAAPSHPAAAPESDRGDLIVVVGSSGTAEYGGMFREWAERWRVAGEAGSLRVWIFDETSDPPATLENLRAALAVLERGGERPLWLVLIGHGTDDGRTARFNLDGPDLDPLELGQLLADFTRPVAAINCASASAPFLPPLARPGRVVVTATKSGGEVNFARFGDALSRSLNDPAADLDKDGQTSLLEAFLRASRLTSEFYESAGRLQTEHALLDDNGDGRPVTAEGFAGVRPINREEAAQLLPDGVIAHQWHLVPSDSDRGLSPELIARRNGLEQQIAALRARKAEFREEEYFAKLEKLFLELAGLLRDATRRANPPAKSR